MQGGISCNQMGRTTSGLSALKNQCIAAECSRGNSLSSNYLSKIHRFKEMPVIFSTLLGVHPTDNNVLALAILDALTDDNSRGVRDDSPLFALGFPVIRRMQNVIRMEESAESS